MLGKYEPTRMHIAHEQLYQQYGKIVRIAGTKFDAIFIYDPNDFEVMFRNEGKYPKRDGFFALRLYRSVNNDVYSKGGLLIMNGQNWAQFRTKVQPYMMKPKLIHNYLPAMNIVANEMVDRMTRIKNTNGQIDNYLNEIYKWALESLGVVALDTKLGLINSNDKNSRPQRMIDATSIIVENSWAIDFQVFPLWRWINKPIGFRWKQFKAANHEFATIALGYIKESMRKIESGLSSQEDPSILQQLLSRPDFDIKDAITMTLDLLMAGIDTTSHTIAFVLYNLAKNPESQQLLYQEIERVVGDSNEVTNAMINEMRFLKACVKESLRITPTVNGTGRTLDHEVVIAGYRIPAKTMIVAINYIPCREEKFFPNALQFIPERWLKENKSETHPFLLLPFGFGPRMCIGRRIAEQEIYLLLIKIFKKFKVEYHYEDIGITVKLINTPDKPLKFSFIER